MISAVQHYTGRLKIPCTSKFIDKGAKLVGFGFYEPKETTIFAFSLHVGR